tara:strand:+ start:161 stop:613 length:453 start_codon:yes stop_codon:yes gene_type:complete
MPANFLIVNDPFTRPTPTGSMSGVRPMDASSYAVKGIFAGQRPEVQALAGLFGGDIQNSLELNDPTGTVGVSMNGGLSLKPAHGHWNAEINTQGGYFGFDSSGNQPGPTNNIQIDGLPEEEPGYRLPTANHVANQMINTYRQETPGWWRP